ncbi:putative 3-beta-hydroxysteroid-Delta(8)Delta(7)-isomerase [Zea mays]|uniref:Putative 3-beta-hydroxysteroid-Delta(8)Delta(7)-isomerase n=1 Tax=Zea mays TaxID=4577 RepID=A0A1D6MP15_MAIZE|nr:putative 3-beta-hydroxysteroid-Delta(8)Delta(7)-isomerase [Zea mays]
MGGHGHPYSPAELQLPGFVPQRLSQAQIVAPFAGTAVLAVLGAWLVSGRCGGGGRLSRTDRLLMGWWLFTALTHLVFEPPFLFTPDFFSKENPNYFDDLCDYAIASRKPYGHILQFAVSLGQLYGCLFYFVTAYLDGFSFWASPFYFWAYFVGNNSLWVVIPTLVATRSWKKISAAFQADKVKTR